MTDRYPRLPPSPRATMRDVAALAGVSLKTVSRVVNGESGVVRGDVRRGSGEAAEQLAFQLNLGARSLRRTDGRTATIGLILENVENPYSSALHRAVENVARSPRGRRAGRQPGRGPAAGARAGRGLQLPAGGRPDHDADR